MSAFDDVPVRVTSHAELRWMERVDASVPNPREAIRRAWDEAIDIDLENVDGETRLHPATQTILVHESCHGDRHARGVKTILFAREGDLRAHCQRCACGAYHAPDAACQCGGDGQ